MQDRTLLEDLVAAIKDLGPHLEALSKPFRQDADGKEPDFDEWSANDWRRNTFGNALVRLQQLTENNFLVIETMSLLAVARYIFELSIWLRLFEKDIRYGLIYYRELLETKRRYFQDTAEHLRREVQLLNLFDQKDREAQADAFKPILTEEDAGRVGAMSRKAMDRVDAEASRHFSLYLDGARKNGYGFQADLVETKAIPQIQQALSDITKKIEEFQSRVPKIDQTLVRGRWEWRRMANEAGILHEHDYIYSFASKLLHATPASLFADEKNLELSEACMFLRYIYAKILEIIQLAQTQPEALP